MEAAREEAEGCDCLPSLQLCHSLGGGPSSGMETLDTVVEIVSNAFSWLEDLPGSMVSPEDGLSTVFSAIRCLSIRMDLML